MRQIFCHPKNRAKNPGSVNDAGDFSPYFSLYTLLPGLDSVLMRLLPFFSPLHSFSFSVTNCLMKSTVPSMPSTDESMQRW